ncbi:MAG: hypothetical protein KAU31_16410, partial [Spirochaetaceae bacterium]|nr:hypothetical protein [Spirochaetaceae bacterium]
LRLAELEKRHLTVLRALTRDLGALLQKYNSARTDTTTDAPESALSLLFNPSLWPRHVVVQETDGVDRLIGPIEPLTVTLTEREGGDSAASIERVTVDTRQDQIRIGNGIVTCTVDSTGAVSIERVDTGVVVDDCIRWRDGGDAGDTYNYDPPAQDRFIESLENVNIQITHQTSLRATVRLEGSLRIPIALSETRTTRTLDATPVWISLSLEMRAGEAFIGGRVTVVNAVRDHRLQICLRVPGSSEVATLSQFSWDISQWRQTVSTARRVKCQPTYGH